VTTTVLFIFDAPSRLRAHLEDRLAECGGVRLVFGAAPAPEAAVDGPDRRWWHADLLAAAAEADVIVGWRPTPDLLGAAERMRLFVHPGVGVQHLIDDFRLLAATRPVVLSNGHGNTVFTAQHVVALLLAITNKVVAHHNWMREGRWRTGDADGKSIPLAGRHVGLLGYGSVNRRVHRHLTSFGPTVSVLRRSWSADRHPAAHLDRDEPPHLDLGAAHRFEPADLATFLDVVDVLSIAVPLTDETKGMIGSAEFARLGPTGLVVNVGRGAVVDEAALFDALRDRTIAGAAVDVWYDYEPTADAAGRRYPWSPHCPFHELDNIVLSPHRAASPFDDLGRWDEVVENIRRVAAGRSDLLNVVDLTRGY
jgi:phosphoglycerate dehydrogenase-like enzyme